MDEKQEPVAWQCQEHGDTEWFDCSKEAYQINPRRYIYRALYTAPPQREWQGLTDEEIKAAWSQLWYDLGNGKFAASDDPSRHTTVMFARAIEAKLKEKNT
jgi:hypothetical protein